MTVAVRRPRQTGKPDMDAGAPASSPEAKVRRPDRRAAKTVESIVKAAQHVMFQQGTSNMSAREVCEQAGISRGTLYRYFESMEAVLEAVALRLRTQTDEELRHALEGCKTPSERFSAFLTYTGTSAETRRASHFLHVEPAFVLKYFENNFDHFIKRVLDALSTVFDAWEKDLGTPLDREAIAEMMVRYALSDTLVPKPEGPPLALRLRAVVDQVLARTAADAMSRN
jgi:AcrR family transcriptional regulator